MDAEFYNRVRDVPIAGDIAKAAYGDMIRKGDSQAGVRNLAIEGAMAGVGSAVGHAGDVAGGLRKSSPTPGHSRPANENYRNGWDRIRAWFCRNADDVDAPTRATGEIADQIAGPGQRLAGQIDEVARRRSLGVDPASGRYRILEEQAALRLEQRVGKLRRDPSGTGDWLDAAGRSYDAVGPVPVAHIDTGSFINQINRHLNKQGLDKVVLDLTGFNSAQRSAIFNHLRTLDPSQLQRILIQRTR